MQTTATANKFAFVIKPQSGILRDSHFIDMQLPWIPAPGMTFVVGLVAFEVEKVAYWAHAKSFRVNCTIASSHHEDLDGTKSPMSREEIAAQLRLFADNHK